MQVFRLYDSRCGAQRQLMNTWGEKVVNTRFATANIVMPVMQESHSISLGERLTREQTFSILDVAIWQADLLLLSQSDLSGWEWEFYAGR